MKLLLLSLACPSLPSRVLIHRLMGPPHAPPQEAAKIQFPLELPAEGRVKVPGVLAAAIQLALEDFRPAYIEPPSTATPEEACLYRRESFKTFAAPGPEGVVFVQFVLDPDACLMNGPVLDVGATYTVDVRGWRILAIQR